MIPAFALIASIVMVGTITGLFTFSAYQKDRRYQDLAVAIAEGNQEEFGRLFAYDIDPGWKTKRGENLVLLAAKSRNLKFLGKILEVWEDPSKIEVIENVNLQDSDGCTPLMYAAMCMDSEMVGLLLTYNADFNLMDIQNRTALHIASAHEDNRIACMLIEKGADVNAATADGSTPLMMSKTVDIAELLFKKGANLNVKDGEGYSALDCAILEYRPAVALFLLQHMADVDQNMADEIVSTLQSCSKAALGSLIDKIISRPKVPETRKPTEEKSRKARLDSSRRLD